MALACPSKVAPLMHHWTDVVRSVKIDVVPARSWLAAVCCFQADHGNRDEKCHMKKTGSRTSRPTSDVKSQHLPATLDSRYRAPGVHPVSCSTTSPATLARIQAQIFRLKQRQRQARPSSMLAKVCTAAIVQPSELRRHRTSFVCQFGSLAQVHLSIAQAWPLPARYPQSSSVIRQLAPCHCQIACLTPAQGLLSRGVSSISLIHSMRTYAVHSSRVRSFSHPGWGVWG